MSPRPIMRSVLAGLLACAATSALALSGSGDSAAGSLDTVLPDAGTLVAPATGATSGETIT